jgi:predicted phage-related endonuclease
MSPWKNAMDVWLEKTGRTPEAAPDPDKEFLLHLGTQLEPVIAALYERATGRRLVVPRPKVWEHPNHPELIGTPDRFVATHGPGALPWRGLELKTESSYSDAFGEPGTDQVPQHYLIQCAHYMAVCDRDVWDIALLHAGSKFAIYTIERDEELEKMMLEQLLEWWAEHVVADRPPAIDGSETWKRFLHARFPENILPIETIEPGAERFVDELRNIRVGEKVLEAMRAELENKLKAVIQDREGVTSRFGKITWRKTKDSIHTDWENAFDYAMSIMDKDRAELQRIMGMFTTTRPGVRRFLFTAPKGEIQDERSINETARKLLTSSTGGAITAPGNGECGASGASKSDDRGALCDGGETPPRS